MADTGGHEHVDINTRLNGFDQKFEVNDLRHDRNEAQIAAQQKMIDDLLFRVEKLEGAAPIEPAPVDPHILAPLGAANEAPMPTETATVKDAASFRDAAGAGGVKVLVEPGRYNFGSSPVLIGSHTVIEGLGEGFIYDGAGLYIISQHHIQIANCEVGNVAGDGIRVNNPESDHIRVDRWTGGYAADEMFDIWYGARRVTLTRCLFPNTPKVDFGFVIGAPPGDMSRQNTEVTIYRCVSYTEQRAPLTGGRYVDVVNCVKPHSRLFAIGYRDGAHVYSRGNWYGPSIGRWDNLISAQGTVNGSECVVCEGDVYEAAPSTFKEPSLREHLRYELPYELPVQIMTSELRDTVIREAGRRAA